MKVWSLFILGLSLLFSEAAIGEEITIATWNLEWFYDSNQSDNIESLAKRMSAPSKADWAWKLDVAAGGIGKLKPTIIALQEIENEKVVQQLADTIEKQTGLVYKVGFKQGTDSATEQDVAFLVKDGVEFRAGRLPFKKEWRSDRTLKDLSKHLALATTLGDEKVFVINVHLIASSSEGRQAQARTLRKWIDSDVAKKGNVFILGDFNAGQRYNETTPDSGVGIIRGFSTSTKADDLEDLHRTLGNRATHISGRELDRILMTPALFTDKKDAKDLSFVKIERRADVCIRGEPDKFHRDSYWKLSTKERDVSDHFPLMATFELK